VTALVVLLPAALAMKAFSRESLLCQFAIACVAGRLWTYHQAYDNPMLAFLLLGLCVVVFQGKGGTLAKVALGVVGLSLWLPGGLTNSFRGTFDLIQFGVFLAGLAVYLAAVRQTPQPDARLTDTSPQGQTASA